MTFPIDKIRSQFPALALEDGGMPRLYFDNPAGTQVPKSVADAVYHCLIHENANLGGTFVTSHASTKIVADAHQAMADFLGTDDLGEIIIGASTTTLAFHLSRSIARDFKAGDEIIVTQMDHEGNVSPWLEIAEDHDLTIRWLKFNEQSWQIEVEDLKELLNDRTKLVALNYASNLTGMTNDVKRLIAEAKKVDALVYLDAVQYTPHALTSVSELGCDFLACSSYKFFGPHLGIVWGKKKLLQDMHAYKCRTVPEEFPTKFETGTPAIELLAGLTATIEYIASIGEQGQTTRRQKIKAAFQATLKYEEILTRQLMDGLKNLDGIEIIGSTSENQLSQHVPTISFRHKTIKPRDIATSLANENIFVWSGHNYALGIVRQLGINEKEGVVRIGMAHYNTKQEVSRVLDAVSRALGG